MQSENFLSKMFAKSIVIFMSICVHMALGTITRSYFTFLAGFYLSILC